MSGSSSSRDILKEVLQGRTASRPLFVPIVFALGARVEHLALPAFLSNPTKISNSLRQIHSRLQADGTSCYFDPFLEVEALGGPLEWPSEQGPAVVHWPVLPESKQLPAALHSPDEMFKKSGRIPVALEVIRRLKSLLCEDSLRMAAVSGPFTLAARLGGVQATGPLAIRGVADSALEVATSAITQVAKAFAEAGADLVFFREDTLPLEQPDALENWISLVTPIFNIVRFYEALPVLQIADEDIFKANARAILRGVQGCVFCASPRTLDGLLANPDGVPEFATIGITLPVSAFLEEPGSGNDNTRILTRLIADLKPALVTTAEDVPLTTDLKRLAVISKLVRR